MVRGLKAPVMVEGGGTRRIGRARGDRLSTAGLSGIRLYEPGALTLVAGAGTPLDEIEAALAAEGQRLAFEPPDLRALLGRSGRSTLGGVAAANAAGPRRVQAGAARDALIGIRFVDGTGQVIRNGGRVMKNVTGYDLVKLMAGSRGRLGVLTEVAFKLQARSETETTLVAEGLADAQGLSALRAALRSPFDVSGAAHAGRTASTPARTVLRLEGLAGSVRYRAAALGQRLGGDWATIEDAVSAALWRDLRDATLLAGLPGALWRLSVVPTEALAVPDALARAGIAHQAIWDWGGGLLWLACAEGADDLIRRTIGRRGHATRLRGAGPAPALPPDDPDVAALGAGLKARFDPRGLFSGEEEA
jgi:glycolate oxidase FAD binding subunit